MEKRFQLVLTESEMDIVGYALKRVSNNSSNPLDHRQRALDAYNKLDKAAEVFAKAFEDREKSEGVSECFEVQDRFDGQPWTLWGTSDTEELAREVIKMRTCPQGYRVVRVTKEVLL